MKDKNKKNFVSNELTNKVYALSNIKRFANKELDIHCNVAEHSYRVGTLAMVTAEVYNLENPDKEQLDVLLVVKKGLLHDVPESVSGDFPGHLKTPSIKRELTVMERSIMKATLKDLPESLRQNYYSAFIRDKSGPEGEVIALWDKLEGFLTCVHEFKRGNMDIKYPLISHILTLQECPKYKSLLEKFSYARKDFEKHMGMLNNMVIQRKAMTLEDMIKKNRDKTKPKFFEYMDDVLQELIVEEAGLKEQSSK